MRRRGLRLLPAVLAAILLSGCTGKPPEIARVTFQLLMTRSPSSTLAVERLSVFLVANDADGYEDLTTLFLIHDGEELFWKIESSDWTKTTFQGETWIGSNGIGMADGSPMPRGEYRALLQDRNGDTVESAFTVEGAALEAQNLSFPKAALADGVISFTGLKESSELWIYDMADRFVTAVPTDKDPVSMAPIVQQNPGLKQGYRFRLYTWDRENDVGLVAGPYEPDSLKTP